MFITLIIFILILGLLVFVHEFGHFWAAKKSGIKVHEFAFGFRPRLVAWKRGETEYAINLLPFGGYVRLEGENEDTGKKGSFLGSSPRTRAKVLVAGVFMNLVLAWVLLTFTYMVGSFPLTQSFARHGNLIRDPYVVIAYVVPGSPAEQVGLQQGDLVTKLDNLPVSSVNYFVDTVKAKAGSEVTLHINRNGVEQDIKVTPRQNPPEGQGALGVAPQELSKVKAKWYLAPVVALQEVGSQITQSFQGFVQFVSQLVVKQKVSEDVSGIVGVGAMTGMVRRLGVGPLMQFVAIISTNLAVINILPLLPLDGGHLLFVILEAIRKKPVSEKFRQGFALAGLTAILLLFVIVTYKDFIRFDILGRLFGWL